MVSVVKFRDSSKLGIDETDLFLFGGFLGVLNEDDRENSGMISLFSLYIEFRNLYFSSNCSLWWANCIRLCLFKRWR